MKSLFAATLLLLALPTHASDIWLDVTIGSKHINGSTFSTPDGQRDYNERNFGLGLTFDTSETTAWKIGFYENSFFTQSVYAGWHLRTNNPTFNAGVLLGGVTGYRFGTVTPVVLPTVSAHIFDGGKILFGIMPSSLFDRTSSSAITFQFSVKIFN